MQDKPRLLDQVREELRVKHYSIRTEQAYLDWIKRFILFYGKRQPETLGNREVSAFISPLATQRKVATSTQNQALSALVFFYQEVLGREFGWLDDLERAKRPARLPVVLTPAEVRAVLARLEGRHELMAKLLYGTGLRLMECVRVRVKDVDFERGEIGVRDGKGNKDRITVLPRSLAEPLRSHLEKVRAIHEKDLAEGFGEVYWPFEIWSQTS